MEEQEEHICSKISGLTINTKCSDDEIADQISSNLREENRELIYKIIKVIGVEEALKMYEKTLHIEENGGILCENGKRRKTPGGVFFYLIYHDESIDGKLKKIFSDDAHRKCKLMRNELKEKRRRQNEELREKFIKEGLLIVEDKKAA